MAARQIYALIYAGAVKEHLRAIERKYRGLIQKAIEKHLQFNPGVKARNRKPLRQPAVYAADWELRCGPDNRFRVFYEINAENREVHVLAVGVKDRERLVIGGEEIEA